MQLKNISWNDFHVYLSVDRKLSEKDSSLSANKSRFFKLQRWFVDHSLDFNRQNFNLFVQEMVQKRYSASYRNNMIKMAKHIDKFLGLHELVDYTYFRENKGIPKNVLTPEEILELANVKIPYQKFADYINQRQQALILFLGTTGCRIGEALGLEWEDICTTTKYSYVVFKDTKNGDDRNVVLSNWLYQLLMLLPKEGDYVFISGRGKKLEQQAINVDLKRRAEATGLQKAVYCHLFRHSVATELIQDGMELSDVSNVLGHRDPKTTMRYKHANLDHFHNAMMVHPTIEG